MEKNSSPKINFIYNPDADADYAISFAGKPKSNMADRFLKKFFPKELYFVIESKLLDKEKSKIIRNYVSDYYGQNESSLKDKFESIKSDWENIKNKYFALVTQLFNGNKWPDGEYIGLGTIFYRYPRFITKKIFFFPLNHKIERYANKVIAHEMLHFMFFDYIYKKYGLSEKSKIPGKEPFYLWKVSEAFNSVIQDWGPYKTLLDSNSNPYPEVAEVYEKMNEQWGEAQDVDALLDKFLRT